MHTLLFRYNIAGCEHGVVIEKELKSPRQIRKAAREIKRRITQITQRHEPR